MTELEECMAATGWKFRQRAATSELMISGGCADLQNPRQEEHSSTPAGIRSVGSTALSTPPVGRQVNS